MKTTYTAEQKQAALAFYEKLGLDEAHRQTRIPKGTISSWAARTQTKTQDSASERMRPALDEREARIAAKRAELKELLIETAVELVKRMALPDTKPRDAQALSIAAGVLTDKFRLESGEASGVFQQLTKQQAIDDGKQRAVQLRPVREAS